jgi:hypothetical protein
MHKVVGCSTLNSRLFEAFVASKTMTATLCGHDHYSDFVACKQGIYLCYGFSLSRARALSLALSLSVPLPLSLSLSLSVSLCLSPTLSLSIKLLLRLY